MTIDAGIIPLTTGQTVLTVAFSEQFPRYPAVVATVTMPSTSDQVISCSVTSVTQTGATMVFAAAIPALGYSLSWMAICE